jgi:hypothetical protein
MPTSLAKSVMTSSPKPKGDGTKVSEYIESKFARECEHCEYFQKPNLCGHKVVMTDQEVKTDKKTGLKIVDPEYGCCRFWHADHHDLDFGAKKPNENKE